MSISESQFAAGSSSPADLIRAAAQRICAIQDRQSEMDQDASYPHGDGVAIAGLLSEAMTVPESEVPIESRALRNAMAALVPMHVDVILGENNSVTAKGWPKLRYAVCIDSIRHCLTIKSKVRVPLKPVSYLLAEYGNDSRKYTYIAKEYAFTNRETGKPEGPFYKDGSVQAQLIEKEAAQPGSVVPAGWHPDDGRTEDVLSLVAVCRNAVATLRRHSESMNSKPVEEYRDPLSIEDLLRQMQFPATIARIKGVSEEEVRAEAARLGIRPTESSDPYQPADIHSPEDAAYRENMLAPTELPAPAPSLRPVPEADATSESSSSAPEFSPVPSAEVDRETQLNGLLRGLLEQNPDVGTPQAMSVLKNSGLSATGSEVGRRLAAMRREVISAAK